MSTAIHHHVLRSVSLSIHPCICPSTSSFSYPSIYLATHAFIWSSTLLAIYVSICRSIYLSIDRSVSLSSHPSFDLSLDVFMDLAMHRSVYLSIDLFSPGHTKCCTCHGKASWHSWWFDTPKCNPSQEISSLSSEHLCWRCLLYCACHEKCICADPLQLSHTCHRFWKCYKTLTF